MKNEIRKNNELEKIKEKIWTELHDKVGICGHCGKKTCHGKSSYSRLPRNIDTDILLEILDDILSEK